MTAAAADSDGDGWTDIYVASRLDRGDPLPQQPRRHVHRRGAAERRRLQRERQGAGGHGARASATSTATAGSTCSRPTSPTTSPRSTATSGGGSSRTSRPRPGSACRTATCEWGAGMPDLDNDGRPDVFYVTGNVYPEIEALLPQYPHRGPQRRLSQPRGGRASRTSRARSGPGADRPALEPRRRVRRLRQRRRRRRPRHEHERAAVAAAQRLRRRQRLDRDAARGHALEPGRPSARRSSSPRAGDTGAGRAQPVELLLARRSAAALRPRRRARAAERVEVRWPSGAVDLLHDVPPGSDSTCARGSAPADAARPTAPSNGVGSSSGRGFFPALDVVANDAYLEPAHALRAGDCDRSRLRPTSAAGDVNRASVDRPGMNPRFTHQAPHEVDRSRGSEAVSISRARPRSSRGMTCEIDERLSVLHDRPSLLAALIAPRRARRPAQAVYGSIAGTVTDTSGAVLPGVDRHDHELGRARPSTPWSRTNPATTRRSGCFPARTR